MMPMIGQTIDGPSGPSTLRLDDLLGTGAFGQVFAATDVTSNKLVAVKFPQIGALRRDSAELVAFTNEVRAAHEIEHPNVVRVLFANSDLTGSTPPYLVMEYIHGGTLKQRLDELSEQNSPLSVGELQAWMNQLLDGIEAINAHMLHRDIKPDNILIDDNTLKIADFGLSKIVGAATRTRTFKGGQHVLYMAPEGWKLESNAIQLDMYAMGIVFFEMATLNFPYELPTDLRGFDLEAYKQMHLFDPPKRMKDFRQDIPSSVDQAVQRMLAKRAQDRFENWNEIRQALANAWDVSTQYRSPDFQSLTDQLLEETSRLHQKKTAEECERERLASIRAEETRIDSYQIDQLVDGIRESIDNFNEQSTLGSIGMSQASWSVGTTVNRHYVFSVPFAGDIQLRFIPLDPPVELKRGLVRVFGYLVDEDGAGFNHILVRKDTDDIYGEWQVCKIGIRATVNPRKYPRRPEPFGFESESEFREQMQHSEGNIHPYKYYFEPASPSQFLEVVREFMRRRSEGKSGVR